MAIGIVLGILVGLLSGSAFLVLIQSANAAKIADPAAILAIIAQLAIVPALWVGVPMLAVGLLHLESFEGLLAPYLASLAFSLAAIAAVPQLAWIRGMAGSWVVSAPEKKAK